MRLSALSRDPSGGVVVRPLSARGRARGEVLRSIPRRAHQVVVCHARARGLSREALLDPCAGLVGLLSSPTTPRSFPKDHRCWPPEVSGLLPWTRGHEATWLPAVQVVWSRMLRTGCRKLRGITGRGGSLGLAVVFKLFLCHVLGIQHILCSNFLLKYLFEQ